MRSLLNRDSSGAYSSWAYPSMLLITGCAVAIGLWARLYDLGFPPEIVWDESYYTRMANKYLHGNYRPNLHPPLGKFIIAAGMAIFAYALVQQHMARQRSQSTLMERAT